MTNRILRFPIDCLAILLRVKYKEDGLAESEIPRVCSIVKFKS